MLVAENLAKQYKKNTVLADISMEVRPGEIVGLLGPNGAGKTTCFYLMVGIVTPDQGKIFIEKNDITELPIHIRTNYGLGYLPQEPSIFRRLTVRQNVMAILQLRRDLNNQLRQRELEHLLDELQVSHLAEQKGISLSGGERRRVEIARALAANPKYMLLDEPFSGVDPIAVKDIQAILLHLKQRGIGVLLTDHNVRETLTICDHAYIISEGYVLASGEPEILLKNKKVREVYLGMDFSL